MTQKERKERSRQEIFCAALDVQDVSTAVKAYFMLREQFFQSRPRHKRIFETAMLRPPESICGIRSRHCMSRCGRSTVDF